MKTKVLHYAAGRDDRIVATYKDVTFIDRHVGWYVEEKDERCDKWDNIAIVERIDGVCFVAEFLSRNAVFDKEHLAAVGAEARNLRAAMQERIARRQWIPLPYVAAYEALGWDARPLKEHRARLVEQREAENREQQRLLNEREARQQRNEEHAWHAALRRAEEGFRGGEFIGAELFIGLCSECGIEIHPRTLGTLRKRIVRVSRTHIQCKGCGRGTRTPSVNGCSRLIEQLKERLQ